MNELHREGVAMRLCKSDCGEAKPATAEFFYMINGHLSYRCRPCDNKSTAARNKARYAADWIARMLAYGRMQGRSSPSYEPTDLDREYVRTLFLEQDGRCGWTGVNLVTNALGRLDSVSLDRLDASRGYRKGNVMLTCLGANLARNKFSEADMLMFVQMVKSAPTPPSERPTHRRRR
jgi:hypothetical protein